MGIAIRHFLVATILSSTATPSPLFALAQDKPAEPTSRSEAGNLFAIIYRQGPNWKAGLPMHKQALREHLEYHRRALSAGRAYAGGGLMDINGGLAILRMSSLDEAKAFLAADPAVLNGTFVGEVHPWTLGYSAEGPLKR